MHEWCKGGKKLLNIDSYSKALKMDSGCFACGSAKYSQVTALSGKGLFVHWVSSAFVVKPFGVFLSWCRCIPTLLGVRDVMTVFKIAKA